MWCDHTNFSAVLCIVHATICIFLGFRYGELLTLDKITSQITLQKSEFPRFTELEIEVIATSGLQVEIQGRNLIGCVCVFLT